MFRDLGRLQEAAPSNIEDRTELAPVELKGAGEVEAPPWGQRTPAFVGPCAFIAVAASEPPKSSWF
jgi:hypothetical protein